jgi:hypothetical protein
MEMALNMYRALVLLLAAATLMTGPVAASPATRSAAKPALKLIKNSPLQVQGVRFKIRQRVRVTASNGKDTLVRFARTTRRGTFLVDFGAFPTDGCSPISFKAVGTRGDRATIVLQSGPPVEAPCWPI